MRPPDSMKISQLLEVPISLFRNAAQQKKGQTFEINEADKQLESDRLPSVRLYE